LDMFSLGSWRNAGWAAMTGFLVILTHENRAFLPCWSRWYPFSLLFGEQSEPERRTAQPSSSLFKYPP
jgi:hypothetical protein